MPGAKRKGFTIGINTHFLKYPSSGIGQYLSHLAQAMLSLDQRNRYVWLNPRGDKGQDIPALQQSIYPVPAWLQQRANAEQLYWEQVSIPSLATRTHVDLLHYPYFAAPLYAPRPVVVTVPDTIQLRLPAYLEGRAKQWYLRLNIAAARRARKIITLSEHAKRDIIECMRIPAERVEVVYIAAGDEFYPIQDTHMLADVSRRYGITNPYIFYLGGLDQRKNVLQLVRAFAQLCERLQHVPLQLFIAGEPDKQVGPKTLFPDPRPVAKELGVEERIIYRYVQERDKAALYSGAQAFVYPSAYEGFGLPPLEAMKCGTPVVCSNRTSLPEVVGDAAFTCDPDDCAALTQSLYLLLTNETLNAEYRARALKRAELFTWQRTATQTLQLYEALMTSSSLIS